MDYELFNLLSSRQPSKQQSSSCNKDQPLTFQSRVSSQRHNLLEQRGRGWIKLDVGAVNAGWSALLPFEVHIPWRLIIFIARQLLIRLGGTSQCYVACHTMCGCPKKLYLIYFCISILVLQFNIMVK